MEIFEVRLKQKKMENLPSRNTGNGVYYCISHPLKRRNWCFDRFTEFLDIIPLFSTKSLDHTIFTQLLEFSKAFSTLRNNNWIQLLFHKVQNAFVAKLVKHCVLTESVPVNRFTLSGRVGTGERVVPTG